MTSAPAKLLTTATLAIALAACVAPTAPILQGGGQVQLRSYQTRAFDTTDKAQVMRGVLATFQDLGFVVDKADFELGSVTGTKFIKDESLRMTVTVRGRSESQLLVRANAQFGLRPIENPAPYQSFFAALGKSLFLAAHEVD